MSIEQQVAAYLEAVMAEYDPEEDPSLHEFVAKRLMAEAGFLSVCGLPFRVAQMETHLREAIAYWEGAYTGKSLRPGAKKALVETLHAMDELGLCGLGKKEPAP